MKPWIIRTAFSLMVILGVSSTCRGLEPNGPELSPMTDEYPEREEVRRYSPWVAGVLNYVLPSAGYFYVGEPLRGICVMAVSTTLYLASIYGLFMSITVDPYGQGVPNNSVRAWSLGGFAAAGALQLWSIYDVVRIARAKNRAHGADNLTLELVPALNPFAVNGTPSAALGLCLSIRF